MKRLLIILSLLMSINLSGAQNNGIEEFLCGVEKHRDSNDPERRTAYQCRLESRLELRSKDPDNQGVLSETVSKRYHTLNPNEDNEIIESNTVSGINSENNIVAQFSGTMHLQLNFYDKFIKVFNLEFPSPANLIGVNYYDYTIVDSLLMEGRKTYLIRFSPKKGISLPVFEGDVQIDAEDWAIRSVHAQMKRGCNVNWLRELETDAQYQRLPDGSWFYQNDKIYVDFSTMPAGASNQFSSVGQRTIQYTDFKFDEAVKVETDKGLVYVEEDILHNTKQPGGAYSSFYDIAKTLVEGYIDIGKFISIGPYLRVASYNDLEGFRTQLGLRTSTKWNKKLRFGGYGAYGVKDHSFKGGLSYEQMFRWDKTRKLSFEANYDVYQFGKGQNTFTTGNLLSSVGMGAQKPCLRLNFDVSYEHEFTPTFSMTGDIAVRRYYSNRLVPMETPTGNPISSVATNELRLKMRYSKYETIYRGYFTKTSLFSSRPVLSLDLGGSIPGLRSGDVGYFRPELSFEWKANLPPIGTSQIRANAGAVFGQVPYMFLHLHEGNASFIFDKTAFSCMDYFEFASDSWCTIFWNHCFGGLLLDRIPLVNKLKMREELTVKTTFGSLSDRNNALIEGSTAPMAFPEGMSPLGSVPYVEIGAGLSNILQLFRVDCFWRLTHREKEIDGKMVNSPRLFAIQVGMELRF